MYCCHSILECCGLFSGVKLSIRSFVLSLTMASACHEILAFISHCLAKFRPILDCFIPNFKLKYEDSENTKVYHVNTVIFSLHQITRRALFGTPGITAPNFIMTKQETTKSGGGGGA